MIDIHSHVLPGMDDGSKSVEESLRLLAMQGEQGASHVAATPHFYAEENSPEEFLHRRSAAVERLSGALTSDCPELLLGAEVHYFEGISRAEAVEALRIGDTGILLLEMPFFRWTRRMVDEVCKLHEREGITVLLAHIERYFHCAGRPVWDALLEQGILMQSNAEFFASWFTKRKAVRMLREGRIHLIGSDCHNLHTRPPRLQEAWNAIGAEGLSILRENTQEIFGFLE